MDGMYVGFAGAKTGHRSVALCRYHCFRICSRLALQSGLLTQVSGNRPVYDTQHLSHRRGVGGEQKAQGKGAISVNAAMSVYLVILCPRVSLVRACFVYYRIRPCG